MSQIKKRKSNNYKYIIALIPIAILMILVLFLIIKLASPNFSNTTQVSKNQSKQEQSNNIQETTSEDEEIKNLSESNRMKRYIGNFFNDIEDENYEDAYNVLNEQFKNTYFPRLNDFIEYANKYFDPSTLGVTYDNIERLGNNKTGNMYVLWVNIANIFEKQEDDEDIDSDTNFVIIENDYNDYEMSFSVIEE
jgi:hypothetical protein